MTDIAFSDFGVSDGKIPISVPLPPKPQDGEHEELWGLQAAARKGSLASLRELPGARLPVFRDACLGRD